MIARLLMVLGLIVATQIDAQEIAALFTSSDGIPVSRERPSEEVNKAEIAAEQGGQEMCVPAKKVVRRARPRRFRRCRRNRCCLYRDRDADWPGKRENTFMEEMNR